MAADLEATFFEPLPWGGAPFPADWRRADAAEPLVSRVLGTLLLRLFIAWI